MISQIPILCKVIIEILVLVLYVMIFNNLYKITIDTFYDTMKEEYANDYYSLLNIFNYILLFFIGSFFLIMNASGNNYIHMIFEFLVFSIILYYGRKSLKLMDHFIFLLFRLNELKEKEYFTMVGSIEYQGKNIVFNHIFANITFVGTENFYKNDATKEMIRYIEWEKNGEKVLK